LNRNKINRIGKFRQGNDTIDRLYSIAEHYKVKYNLTTFIDIVYQGFDTYYQAGSDFIFFALEYIQPYFIKGEIQSRISNIKTLQDAYIACLLHELCHAIEQRQNPERAGQEMEAINQRLYKTDVEYHHNQPFEQRADQFANDELAEIKKGVLCKVKPIKHLKLIIRKVY